MFPNQKTALDCNMLDLTEAIKTQTSLFFHYLESRGVISSEEREMIQRESHFNAQELTSLIQILKGKDSGWLHLLSYLRANDQVFLANKLTNDADAAGDTSNEVVYKSQKRSVLEEFSVRLAQYYRQNYAHLPTMGESPKHVKDVWVPLQIDGRSEDHLAADRIDHVELLSRLKSSDMRNVALIKGDPGMGKTTLAKKIAYDWAINHGSTDPGHFSLVLAVPLRSAGISNRFDQLAIDYFISVLSVDGIDKYKLMKEISRLESQLLVILDGLDEYRSFGKSRFNVIFAKPFEHPSTSCSVTPPMISYKLIITSRPYACERVNEDFFPIRFVILTLDADHLSDFVQLYCQTPHGVDKVTEYLKVNAKLVIHVPLILTFVCFLADSVHEIPTNMTSLYDSFIRQMLRRESRQDKKLEESVNVNKWKESKVAKTTSELAYQGCTAKNYEFTSDSLEMCHVANDSFICGFLLHKFDFTQECLLAEFPHRSIQEFFAALHCRQLMLSGSKDMLEDVQNLILTEDSQVGRFLFGVRSKEGQFDQLIEWLSPSLNLSGSDWFSHDMAINLFGASLSDCSCAENRSLGQTLLKSNAEKEKKIADSWNRFWPTIQITSLSDDFKSGLHFNAFPTNSLDLVSDWYVVANRHSARLVVVQEGLSELLEKLFEQIDVLVIAYASDSMDWESYFVHIKQLPPVTSLIVTTACESSYVLVTFCISYAAKCDSKLTNLRFEYDTGKRGDLLELVQKEEWVDVVVEYTSFHEGNESNLFKQLKVTVNDDNICQSTLIFSLIRLSLL